MSVDRFVERLQETLADGNVANPYNCYTTGVDAMPEAFRQRSLQLAAYLRHRQGTARTILIAEAPGYQGARFSGIAMTSERLLSGTNAIVTEQDILGQQGLFRRTSHNDACKNDTERQHGFTEPTATVVWGEIMAADMANSVVLWNTFPFHPHDIGDPLTNRKPNGAEIHAHAEILVGLRALFDPHCRLVAVGNVAMDHLRTLGIEANQIRHPANGGAARFRAQFQQLVNPA